MPISRPTLHRSPAVFDQPLRGIALTAIGYGLFSVQDATVKWLVSTYAVPQILFTRSLVILLIAALIGRRDAATALARSRNKGSLAARAALMLAAWMLYYSAARDLGLAQLTTLYFAAPIIVVALSGLILKEKVGAARWSAVLAGFLGVLLATGLAAGPGRPFAAAASTMALTAALCWALSVILVRMISRSESTPSQMLATNGLFALACAPMLFAVWTTPDGTGWLLMVGLGIAGGLGQFFLYEGFRYAPASVVAPIEYTGLLWAFAFGYLIWSDVPGLGVVAGAALIAGGSLGLIWFEWRHHRSSRLERKPLS